jgi:hypothetical protein
LCAACSKVSFASSAPGFIEVTALFQGLIGKASLVTALFQGLIGKASPR